MGGVSAEASVVKKHHRITGLHFEGNFMILTIDGQKKRFKLSEVSPALHRASEQEKNAFEISPSGYGIHWPLLDEDLSIDGLLGIPHKPQKRIKA